MARKLKTYQTALGFFDLAIAAPSMKAALQAWGADSNLFHQGAAKESDDADVIAATMAKPGVVLKRPVGSDGAFGEHAELPTHLGDDERPTKAARNSKAAKRKKPSDKAAERAAARAFERQQNRRERERADEEAARRKAGERRQHAIDRIEAALAAATQKHARKAAALQAEVKAIAKRARAEDMRWIKERELLEAALRRASAAS
ncbi:cell envelope biogenesis protein TolA [Bradyrhizobium sp.]|uniref:cell envelope biogenesis protein TolA n=1 Tax=Bradyrhizobium sp. TaxID=376 RepID=UPI0025C25134|nr:cell envelope biogenesis protein TolA [Bradyrhizobium sp.]